MVLYAGSAGTALAPTSGANKGAIIAALDQMGSGGGTNGEAGIEQAYALAQEAFIEGGINRVILATDGDFNVGTSSHEALLELIEAKRRSGVELSVLGYGLGHRDHTMEQLADKGNGNYAYIDGFAEAHKVLVEEAGATLVTIAKDVKIQVAMDPARVRNYRLVGYENRRLAHRDFADDAKDAGEIGAGHTVTALYEVEPVAGASEQAPWMSVALRYKAPAGKRSTLLTLPVVAAAKSLDATTDDFRFSAAVASFGMLLRQSEYAGQTTWASARALAREALGDDPSCRRHELLTLVTRAAQASGQTLPSLGLSCAIEGTPPAAVEEIEVIPPPVEATGDVVEVRSTVTVSSPPQRDWKAWALEVLRLLPPLVALPMFVMAFRRRRRRR
ncbi:MAG: DUF3520 domain-containing protein [Deltaproteobacteria bacterium]|nr:DUF3520 domain-containing protein [Deltaproteobacteria bacterium]